MLPAQSETERARYFTAEVRINGERHGVDTGVTVLSAEGVAARLAQDYVDRAMGAKTIRIAVDLGPEVE